MECHGLEYEADQRHVELVIKELGLATAKPVSTPSTTEEVGKLDEVLLNAGHSQKFRSVAARVNFLAQDRPDLQHASRGVLQHMSNPTNDVEGSGDTSVVLLDVSNIFTGARRTRICSVLRTVIWQDQSEMPSQRVEVLSSGAGIC